MKNNYFSLHFYKACQLARIKLFWQLPNGAQINSSRYCSEMYYFNTFFFYFEGYSVRLGGLKNLIPYKCLKMF